MTQSELELAMERLLSKYGRAECEMALCKSSVVAECEEESSSTPPKEDGTTFESSSSADPCSFSSSSSLSQSLLDASVDACFVTDESGIVQLVNQSVLAMFGYDTKEQLLGRNISQVVGGGMSAKVHMDHIRRAADQSDGESFAHLDRILNRMRDVKALRQDGSEFSVQVVIRRIELEKVYFVAFCHDLTRHHRQLKTIQDAQEKAVAEQNLLSRVLDSCFESVIVTDSSCQILRVNKATLNEFGYEKAELIGKNIAILIGDPHHAKLHDHYVEKFFQKGEDSSTLLGKMRRGLKGRRKDGTIFACQIGIQKLDKVDPESGKPLMVGFIHNIGPQLEAVQLALEKTAAEELLFNMLPNEVAHRLKDDPGHIADSFATATILFADIVGFTELSSRLLPVAVVALLNEIFCKFDDLLEGYALNKVKTIGDCYMVTSVPSARHPEHSCAAVCHFATDLVQAVQEYNDAHPDRVPLNVRIGINTGPVVAGVVGTKRFMYDVWGHAVNLASRMESTGVPGRIQVSPEVLECLGDKINSEFVVERRGPVQVKGVGEVETHFLTSSSSHSRSYKQSILSKTDNDAKQRRLSDTLKSLV